MTRGGNFPWRATTGRPRLTTMGGRACGTRTDGAWHHETPGDAQLVFIRSTGGRTDARVPSPTRRPPVSDPHHRNMRPGPAFIQRRGAVVSLPWPAPVGLWAPPSAGRRTSLADTCTSGVHCSVWPSSQESPRVDRPVSVSGTASSRILKLLPDDGGCSHGKGRRRPKARSLLHDSGGLHWCVLRLGRSPTARRGQNESTGFSELMAGHSGRRRAGQSFAWRPHKLVQEHVGGPQRAIEREPELVAQAKWLHRRHPRDTGRSLREAARELAALGHVNKAGRPSTGRFSPLGPRGFSRQASCS